MLLGVDGGGTKTVFVLTGSDGKIRGVHRDSSAYHVQIGLDGLLALLERGLAAVLQQSGSESSDIAGAFFGIPALGEDSRCEHDLISLPAKVLGHSRYICGNDMICAWAGSLGARDGINVIAGTGSIAYGERQGASARCGGWGELIGDEGSAYWIAREGLTATSRMSDGRCAKGPLLDLMRKKFDLENDLDLSGLVLTGPTSSRDQIAALCSLVVDAANVGDITAQQILTSAGIELAAHISAVANQLEFPPSETIPVSYSGGAVSQIAAVRNAFAGALELDERPYNLVQPAYSPTTGALLLAARIAKITLQPAALENIDSTLKI